MKKVLFSMACALFVASGTPSFAADKKTAAKTVQIICSQGIQGP